MPLTIDRSGNAGTIASRRNTITIAATPVAVTAGATATASFAGAAVGDIVTVSPSAALTAGVAIAYAAVLAVNVVTIGFNNVGANATVAAGIWTCKLDRY